MTASGFSCSSRMFASISRRIETDASSYSASKKKPFLRVLSKPRGIYRAFDVSGVDVAVRSCVDASILLPMEKPRGCSATSREGGFPFPEARRRSCAPPRHPVRSADQLETLRYLGRESSASSVGRDEAGGA